jgi:hypothetical protein
MKTPSQTSFAGTGLVILTCAILMTGVLLWPALAAAQVPPPPPPPDTPTNTAVVPPTPTDTPQPTDTPEPTNTPIPTSTSTPEPTNTHTAPPTPSIPPTPIPENTKKPKPPQNPKPDPNCQSTIGGTVIDRAGQPAQGATVTIEGSGWSNGMLTDDGGNYGFGGLCPGTASLRAFLVNGQTSPAMSVNLDGQNYIQLNLSVSQAGATVPAQSTEAAQQTPTPQPDMPTTGYSGWLLLGGALLATLLLLSAGARRLLGAREDTDRPQ